MRLKVLVLFSIGILTINLLFIINRNSEKETFQREVYTQFLRNQLRLSSLSLDIINEDENKVNVTLLMKFQQLATENYYYSLRVTGSYVDFPDEVTGFSEYIFDLSYYLSAKETIRSSYSDEELQDFIALSKKLEEFTTDVDIEYLQKYQTMKIQHIKEDLILRATPIHQQGYTGFYGKSID